MQGGQHYAKYFLFEVTHMGILAKAFVLSTHLSSITYQSPSPAASSYVPSNKVDKQSQARR
jgi:hypothetical protein